jgi:uncharacterized integral membrane protein
MSNYCSHPKIESKEQALALVGTVLLLLTLAYFIVRNQEAECVKKVCPAPAVPTLVYRASECLCVVPDKPRNQK